MHLLGLPELTPETVFRIFQRVDTLADARPLEGKGVLAIFPDTSIRTCITFERGITQLGGSVVRFPPETLDRNEDFRDLTGYLANWISLAVIRHPDFEKLQRFAHHATFPVVNAMTQKNHPCEILSDLYALSRRRPDWRTAHYLFIGARGNICDTWLEAAHLLGLDMTQCCLPEFRSPISGPTLAFDPDIQNAIPKADIVLTDGLPPELKHAAYLDRYRITRALMAQARPGAICNPCPPFTRGGEVSEDLVDSPFFVGYGFKACLQEVQKAILLECLQTP